MSVLPGGASETEIGRSSAVGGAVHGVESGVELGEHSAHAVRIDQALSGDLERQSRREAVGELHVGRESAATLGVGNVSGCRSPSRRETSVTDALAGSTAI